MKILNEFVPTRKFFKLAEELKDLVDGWNVTDSAAGYPAPYLAGEIGAIPELAEDTLKIYDQPIQHTWVPYRRVTTPSVIK
jgi:hypothetical protein